MITCVLCGASSSSTLDVELFSSPCTHVDEDLGLPCSICSELDKLDRNIDKATTTLEHAIEQRSAFLAQVNHHCDPIQRLPVELITAVFTLCLPRLPSLNVFDGYAMRHDQDAVRPIQFLLGSICRYWRQVVWSSPHLWNTLSLHVSARTTRAQSDLVAEWLDRSGRLPLDIAMFYNSRFDEVRRNPRPSTPAINHMIDTLSLYASRMRVFRLRMLGCYISHFGRKDAKVQAANSSDTILEDLSIDVLDSGPNVYRTKFSLGVQMPKLTHVCFRGIFPTINGVDWKCITCIEAKDIDMHHALAVLERVPQLQRLKLGITGIADCVSRITRHSLKVLEITQYDSDSFLQCLTCPALEELIYSSCPALLTFLDRSVCPLRKLVLTRGSSKDVVPLLCLTPLLTDLTMNSFGLTDKFLTCFGETEIGFGGLFLPRLRSFTIDGVSFSPFRWSKIPSLIRPPTSCRPMTEIKINFEGETDLRNGQHVMDSASLVETLKLVRDRGVVLKVLDSEGNDLIRWWELVHEII